MKDNEAIKGPCFSFIIFISCLNFVLPIAEQWKTQKSKDSWLLILIPRSSNIDVGSWPDLPSEVQYLTTWE